MRKLAALIAGLALAYASPAAATNGMRMIGFGPVQTSMGGVGVGATLDGAAIASNPAGLTELPARLDLGIAWFVPTVSYDATGAAPGYVLTDGATIDSDRGGSPIPTFAYVRPLTPVLSIGLGAFAVAGMGVDYGANLYSSPTLTSYLQARLAPAVAYKLGDMVSVGLTANLMLAQMKYDVASVFGQAEHDTATSLGAGATIGVKVRPTKMITLGAAYETKSFFQDFSFDVPARTTPFGDLPAGTDELAFDQPAVATVGVAIEPMDMLLVAADVAWINWSSVIGENQPEYTSDPAATGAMPFNMNWSDQWVLKIGAQVKPMPTLALRVGYNYGKMPLDEDRAFENIAFPAVAEQHITAGAGYAVTPNLTLEVAGMYAPEAKVSGANAAPPPPTGTGQGIASYTSKMSQYQIDLGLAYRF